MNEEEECASDKEEDEDDKDKDDSDKEEDDMNLKEHLCDDARWQGGLLSMHM